MQLVIDPALWHWTRPQLWLRFYGRFLFVRSGTHLSILAVDLTTEKTECHDPILSILEKNVQLIDTKDGPKNLTPTERLMGTDLLPFNGALNTWDIKQTVITLSPTGGVTWPKQPEIPLADLSELSGGKTIDRKFLQTPTGRVTAVINVNAGSEVSFHLPTKGNIIPTEVKYHYVYYNSPHIDTGEHTPLADMVQITVPWPDDFIRLSVTSTADATKNGVVTITPGIDKIVVVSFSNLCSAPASTGPDLEFAGFYDLLPDFSDKSQWKVPQRDTAMLNSMPPFGDCFLGAMISM